MVFTVPASARAFMGAVTPLRVSARVTLASSATTATRLVQTPHLVKTVGISAPDVVRTRIPDVTSSLGLACAALATPVPFATDRVQRTHMGTTVLQAACVRAGEYVTMYPGSATVRQDFSVTTVKRRVLRAISAPDVCSRAIVARTGPDVPRRRDFAGASRDSSECPTNTYGAGCAKTCDCGPYGASCSRREGLCTCKPGFIGVKCRETCPPGTHGQNCTLTCSCDPITSLCSPIDGHCLCKPGYTGSDCQNVCTKGTWGRNCSQTCNCGGRGTCNAVSGRCNCQPGYKGNNCELQCTQDIYYGPNCENLCSCNGAHCDHRDGTCRCPPGKIGHHCEKGCPENYFGFMCAQACGCQNGGKCDPVSGACTCQPGWAGQLCTDSCPTGYYGVDCSQVCQPCYNGGSCDTFSGTCVCAPSYTGPSCNTSLIDSPFPPGHQKQQSVATSGVNMSSGHFAGMLVGIAILFVVGVIIAVVITRRCSHGTFNRSGGAMKFNEFSEEELENRQSRPQGTTASSFGFDNPVHVDFNEIALNLDKKSVTSDSTSGVASGKMDSDEEDSDNFFKDSDS
ncbi:MEGF6-like protein [Mya arenaria]|uniref:MEGF6-like protein n=1 Tax=Mya arenaria TaxID=6604 RepID=A0ABY7E5N4_MYAAR|nr:MEGF6-like protein [Mya arenaria]